MTCSHLWWAFLQDTDSFLFSTGNGSCAHGRNTCLCFAKCMSEELVSVRHFLWNLCALKWKGVMWCGRRLCVNDAIVVVVVCLSVALYMSAMLFHIEFSNLKIISSAQACKKHAWIDSQFITACIYFISYQEITTLKPFRVKLVSTISLCCTPERPPRQAFNFNFVFLFLKEIKIWSFRCEKIWTL